GDVSAADWNELLRVLEQLQAAQQPAAAQPSPNQKPFELTQLVGWLSSPDFTGGQVDFFIRGETRYTSAEYADGARLDVLGPDGSQWASHPIDVDVLTQWLEGGDEPDPIAFDEPSDLKRALMNAQQQEVARACARVVRGRLWRSDGAHLGVRHVAFFAPPAF